MPRSVKDTAFFREPDQNAMWQRQDEPDLIVIQNQGEREIADIARRVIRPVTLLLNRSRHQV